MVTRLILVTILQSIQKFNHYVVHLKILYVNYTSVTKEKKYLMNELMNMKS